MSQRSPGLNDILKKHCPETALNPPVALRPRCQTDGVSCGVIMLENISDLFQGTQLPKSEVMDREKVFQIRHRHLNYLQEKGWDLDI